MFLERYLAVALVFLGLTASQFCYAQTSAPNNVKEDTIEHLHAILRPDPTGKWFIQNDIDHKPIGISLTVEQTDKFIRIFFNKTYSYAGVIQISSDDGFLNKVTGHASLGLNNATIQITHNKKVIRPVDITKINRGYSENGNFWVSVTMINPRN